jgi:Tfp pilus assembly major pilin PilA
VLESSSLQATVGKLALGIKVTDMQGERISFGRALGRAVCRIISNFTFFIGYVVAAFTARRQTLHDMIASTLVVRKRFEPEAVASAGPAPSGGVGIVIAVVGVFFVIMMMGMMAAIAIPAYQDYTIRSQVTEGLNAAAAYKAAVAEAYAGGNEFGAITTESLRLESPQNLLYVDSLEVISGAIEIKYGNRANARISGKSLVIVPGSDANHDVVWMCGRQSPPHGVQPAIADAAQYTSIENKYLPSGCRGT